MIYWCKSEKKQSYLTNKTFEDWNIKIFEDKPGDHKCYACSFRYEEDKSCNLVNTQISFPKGTCAFFAFGKASEIKSQGDKIASDTAGYAVSDSEVNCGTCIHFKSKSCLVWEEIVGSKQCCMAWEK